jgi:hypothetical protein
MLAHFCVTRCPLPIPSYLEDRGLHVYEILRLDLKMIPEAVARLHLALKAHKPRVSTWVVTVPDWL